MTILADNCEANRSNSTNVHVNDGFFIELEAWSAGKSVEALFPLNPIKHGRMTAYDAEGKTKTCVTVSTPLRPEDLARNLRLDGHQGRVGYLPGGAETTPVGMVDIDRKNFPSQDAFETAVGQVTEAMDRHGVKWYRENSTNGGAHLWVFLSEGLGYGQVRDFLKVLTAEAGQPNLETYPAGDKASSTWVFIPYAGVENHPENLGLTYLQDRHGHPIPLWQLEERVERTPISVVVSVLGSLGATTLKEAQPTQAAERDPVGLEGLKQAVLQPPVDFRRHDCAEAFLNVAESMGRQAEMADFLKSSAVFDAWVTDGSRTADAWAAEIDRWLEAKSDHQYGVKFLLDQGWQIPDLPKLGQPAVPVGGKLGQRNALMEAFKAIERKYAPEAVNTVTGIDELQDFGFDNLNDLPTSEPLVENILIKRSLCALIGKSGAGKSMIALDVAFHVALGMPWRGRKVERGGVAWIAAEGIEETADRMEAWRDLHGKRPTELASFRVLNAPSKPLTDVQQGGGLEQMILGLKRIEAKTGPLALIVVDTVSRTYGVGMEENDNNDMVFYTNCAELLTRVFGCTVWLLHHQGKGNSGEARGASAFNAPMETITAIDKKTGHFDLTTVKMRSGPGEPEAVPIRLVTREINRGGKVRGVGVVDHNAIGTTVAFGPDLLTGEMRRVFDALEDLSRNADDEMDWVPRKDWRKEYESRGGKTKTFNYELKRLVEQGLVFKQTEGKEEQYRPGGQVGND